MLATKHFHKKSKDYVQHRFCLPTNVCDYLCAYINDDPDNFLDIGCGSGQLTIPLSHHFNHGVGVDPDKQMLAEAIQRAKKKKINNIDWLNYHAENIPNTIGNFNLITIANAFHWMDHTIVTPWIKKHLKPNGTLSLIGSYEGFFDAKENEWQFAVREIWDKWFLSQQKSVLRKRFNGYTEWQDILAPYNFSKTEIIRLPHKRIWDIERIIGYSRSLSFYQLTSDSQAKEFAHEIRDTLLKYSPDGNLEENYDLILVMAKK